MNRQDDPPMKRSLGGPALRGANKRARKKSGDVDIRAMFGNAAARNGTT
jgi:hypothetical protein